MCVLHTLCENPWKVEVLCEKHALKMYVGPSHTVKDLLNYVNSILTETTTFEGDCVCSGLTRSSMMIIRFNHDSIVVAARGR